MTMMMMRLLLAAVAAAALLATASAQYDEDGRQMDYEIYCGQENCYEVLGVEPEATTREIKRAYRNFAKVLHPDQSKDEDTTEKFQRIAAAYEVLSNSETRENYDYLLAHPDEYYANMYRYYKHRAAPKVNVLPIVIFLIIIISICQHLYWKERHSRAIDVAMNDRRLYQQAKRHAEELGVLVKKNKVMNQKIIRSILEEKVDSAGAFAPAEWKDVLGIQILLLPVTLARYVAWYANWIFRINISGQELTEEDKEYLKCKYLGVSPQKFDYTYDDAMKEECEEREVWIEANAKAFLADVAKRKHDKQKGTARYKREKRWMKNNGGGSANYLDDDPLDNL